MSELLSNQSKAIFLLKPSGIDKFIGRYKLPSLIEGIFLSASLNIREKTEVFLDEIQIKAIYPVLDIPDPVYGEDWKADVINHLSKKPVLAYLLTGEDAYYKVKLIRNSIRGGLIRDHSTRSKIVENFVHVPNEDEFEIAEGILFGDI